MSTTEPLAVPPATADPVDHADWVELRSLAVADGNTSHADLVAELRRTGSAEAFEHGDSLGSDSAEDDEQLDGGSERSQNVADTAFVELEDRARAAGDGYPFNVGDGNLQAVEGARESVYVFLLCLSVMVGKERAGINPRRLFEDIASAATHRYFGGERRAALFRFGFPRRMERAEFRPALDALCSRMGEGVRARHGIAIAADQKDAKLDFVVWKGFPDEREGMVVGFGQCATGANWRGKTGEMNPQSFSELWMERPMSSRPVRMFSLPRRVDASHWEQTTRDAGVVLDRCRLAWLCDDLSADLLTNCGTWTAAAIEEADIS